MRSATTDELPCAMLPNGPGVHEDRRVLQRLHQVGLQRVAHDHGHRARAADLLGGDRRALATCSRRRCGRGARASPASDVASAKIAITSLAAVMSKPVWRGTPSSLPPRPDDDVAQRAVVDVEHAPPGDVVRVDVGRVALVEVVVEHRGEQVVRRGDRVEVAGEVQVEDLHRHDLAVAAARGAALDPERRAHRRLADRDRGPLADVARTPGRARPWWWSCPRPAAWG